MDSTRTSLDWLVVEPYPSEKKTSSMGRMTSHIWHGKKKCSKPPTSWYHILKGPSVRPCSEETHHVSQHPTDLIFKGVPPHSSLTGRCSCLLKLDTSRSCFLWPCGSPRDMQCIQAESFGLGWFWLHFSFAIHAFHVYVTATSLQKKRKVHSATSSATITVRWTATDRRSVSRARRAALVVLPWIQEQTPLEGMHFWKVPPNHPSHERPF